MILFYDISLLLVQIEGIDFGRNARNHEFEYEGGTVSLLDYFRIRYNITLQFPDAPLVQVAPKSRQTYLPPELIYVSQQKVPVNYDLSLRNALAGMRLIIVMSALTITEYFNH